MLCESGMLSTIQFTVFQLVFLYLKSEIPKYVSKCIALLVPVTLLCIVVKFCLLP